MIVVADTSPLNYLVLIGEIDLLSRLFRQVIIPPAVLAELHAPRTPAVVREWATSLPLWIETRTASFIDPGIRLGKGEVEAICLAGELHADQLLVDDRKARTIALARGLKVAGTLNILDAAARREMIDLPRAITELLQTNFRAPADLVRLLLERDAERRRSVGQRSSQD
jgi:predicted nucleic acid-binding protein